MAFIAFPNTRILPFPIKGKGDSNPNMMQGDAAIFIFCGRAQDHESLYGEIVFLDSMT